VFDTVKKSSEVLLEIITLVPSANKMDSDKVFVIGGRSFVYGYIISSVWYKKELPQQWKEPIILPIY
jgi:hypothetical protein